MKLLFGLCVIFLVSCGGGNNSTTSGFSQTYTTSAAQGELITYTVNTTNLTYSYKVIKSQYGCEVVTSPCNSGSGSLVKNADKSFSVSGATSSKFYALQNGLLIGSIKLGSMPQTPIIGIPNPISTGDNLAGTYNYVSLQCPNTSNGLMAGCLGKYGSLNVISTGTNTVSYNICVSDDIENSSRNCASTSKGTGTYDSTINSWKFLRTGSTQENFMVAFTATSGKKVAFVDFNDPGGYGYGQATLSEKEALTPAMATANAGQYFMVSLVPGADSTSLIVTANSDGTVSTGGTLIPNSPWNGMVSSSQDPSGRFIMAGSGVFVYGGWTDLSGRPKYMIGMKM